MVKNQKTAKQAEQAPNH